MKIMSFLSMLLILSLLAASLYMYFNHYFALNTTLAVAVAGLFLLALIVMLRLLSWYDQRYQSISGASTFSPTNVA